MTPRPYLAYSADWTPEENAPRRPRLNVLNAALICALAGFWSVATWALLWAVVVGLDALKYGGAG